MKVQKEAWDKEERPAPEQGEEPVRFEYQADEEDTRNNEMYAAFREREKAWREKVAAEQRANLEKKQTILGKLQELVANEENIGKMFDAFNTLTEEWNAVGNVPGDQYRELHDQWHRLRDEFFYNVNIYKQLQEHDLQINLKKKEELIAQASQLEAVTDLKEKEMLARSYMKAWFDVGPSPRETYQELADTFFGHTRAALDAVKAHYDSIREGFQKNLEAKQALVEEVRALLEEEVVESAAWPAQAEKGKDVQKRWKMVGFAGRKDDQEVWEQFRGLCDLFFQKRDAAFADVREAQKKVKDRKEAIAKEAAELAESQDWKATSDRLIALQKEWKDLGSAGPRDENRLWRKFRGACDTFFTARKSVYADRDKEHKANLKKKETLIAEIEAFELSGKHGDDLKSLKEFSTRWAESGHVPRRAFEQIVERYRAAMDQIRCPWSQAQRTLGRSVQEPGREHGQGRGRGAHGPEGRAHDAGEDGPSAQAGGPVREQHGHLHRKGGRFHHGRPSEEDRGRQAGDGRNPAQAQDAARGSSSESSGLILSSR